MMDYTTVDIYMDLRSQALKLAAAQAGLADGTYGVVMETVILRRW